MEMFISIKLDLSQKVFDKFKKLTTTNLFGLKQMDVKTAFLNGNLTCWKDMQASKIHLWIKASILELEYSF